MDETITLVVAAEGVGSRGAYHWVTLSPIHAGRLHRKAGDALCKPRAKFRDLEHTDRSSRDVTCPRCIEIAERLGATTRAQLGRAAYQAPEFDVADDVNAIEANADEFPDPHWVAKSLDSLRRHFGDWRFSWTEVETQDGPVVPLWTAQHRCGDVYRTNTLGEMLNALPSIQARYEALVPKEG